MGVPSYPLAHEGRLAVAVMNNLLAAAVFASFQNIGKIGAGVRGVSELSRIR